ncbi:MAG: acetyl-CoA hydrolase/transferase family protein [Burkholderiales bacterium]|nr:acetyl-CoA hydrolase/transferase family protein [Burkholderiales bacterium]
MKLLDPASLDLRQMVRSGDSIVVGEAAAEPQTLTEALVAQRAALGRARVFLGVGLTATFAPAHRDHLAFTAIGGAVTHRRLARAGCLDVLPCHFSQVGEFLRDGRIDCDVLFLQVSPADAHGMHSFALACDYMRAAVERARVVVAEINRNAPQTPCDAPLSADEIDFAIETDRPLIELGAAVPGATERRIAAHIEALIPDRATLQMGIGAIPEAVMGLLGSRRDLGVHSGMIGDAVADLVERGVVTNAHKGVDPGVTVAGVLLGTQRLYRFAHRNPALRLAPTEVTHGAAALGRLRRLVSINSALEVDLTGQVNAEAFGADYIGAVGGQVDYVRAAARSADGLSIIALPATAGDGSVSRIVASLSGPVTTARSDVDVVVTEHGVAHLRGRTLRERVRAMLAIAAPEHREAIARAAGDAARDAAT